MAAHSETGASALSRLEPCAGSRALARLAPPQPDTVHSATGTAVHWVAESSGLRGGFLIPQDFIGDTAPNGVVITEAMADTAYKYLNNIHWITAGKLDQCQYEMRLEYPGVEDAFGTADTVWYNTETSTVYVWDLKNGYETVPAIGNPQGAFYCISAAKHYGAERAVFTINQPNAEGGGHLESWELDADELKRQDQRIRNIITATEQPDAPRVPGAVQCRYCPAAGFCPENRAQAWARVYSSHLAHSDTRNPETVANELRALDVAIETAKARRDHLEKYGFALAEHQGRILPGFKLVNSVTRRKVSDEQGLRDYAAMMGKNITEDRLLSLGKLDKIIGKSVMEGFTERPEGAKKLVPENNRGAAVTSDFQNKLSTPYSLPEGAKPL